MRKVSRLAPEQGLANIDTTQRPDFDRQRERELIADIQGGRPISREDADQFLVMDHTPPETWLDRNGGTAVPTTGLILGSIITKAEIGMMDDPPSLGHVSEDVHTLLNTAFGYVPFANDMLIAQNTEVIEHVPGGLVTAAIVYGTYRGVTRHIATRHDIRAKTAQATLRHNEETGTQKWDLSGEEHAMVGMTGSGSVVADSFILDDQAALVQITYGDTQDVHVKLPQDSTADETRKAFRDAGLVHADELLIFTNSRNNEIFTCLDTSETTYMAGVDRVTGQLRSAKRVTDAAGVDPKPVFIFGSELQPVVTLTARHSQDFTGRDEKTMQERVTEMREGYGAPIEVIDMDELVVGAIDAVLNTEISDGPYPPLILRGSEKSVKKYAEGFFAATRHRHADPDLVPTEVFYNVNDRSTVVQATRGSFAVVRENSRIQTLRDHDLDDDHIIVIADLARAEFNRRSEPLRQAKKTKDEAAVTGKKKSWRRFF